MSARSRIGHQNSKTPAAGDGEAEHAAPVTEGARRALSADEQQRLLGLPVHDAEAIKSYSKPHEGFERVGPLAMDRLRSYPIIASALRIDIPGYEADGARARELAQQEDIAFRLHRRALENRLCIESEMYKALLRLNRFVQSSGDGELQRDFKELSDWIAARTAGGRRRDAGAAGENEEEEEPAGPDVNEPKVE